VAVIDKPPGGCGCEALTVSPAVTLPVTLPLVPVTENAYDPTEVLEPTDTVRVEVAVEVAPVAVKVSGVGGKKLGVEPPGSPLTLRATAPANAPVLVKVTVYVASEPRTTDRLAGEIWTVMPGLVAAASTLIAPATTAPVMNAPISVRTARLTVVVDFIGTPSSRTR